MSRDNIESSSHVPETWEETKEESNDQKDKSKRELERKNTESENRIDAELADLYKTEIGKRIQELEELKREGREE